MFMFNFVIKLDLVVSIKFIFGQLIINCNDVVLY